MMIVRQDLPDNIAKEFEVNEKGYGSVSRRGIARLCGVRRQSIQHLLNTIEQGKENLPKNLQPFAGQRFEGGQRIPDTLAAAIIKYYSRQGRETAQDTDDAIGAIGLRTIIQKTLGWEAPRRLTEREILDIVCLPMGRDWELRFTVEFYSQLARLTGLKAIGHKRPLYWAKLTKELIYDYLPTGVYDEIKAWQLATDSNNKLHQYLSDQGLEILNEQLKKAITVMSCAGCINEVAMLLAQSHSGQYQLNLMTYSGKR